jgi:hypothetical protein
MQAQRPSYKQAVQKPAPVRAQQQWRRQDSNLPSSVDRVKE